MIFRSCLRYVSKNIFNKSWTFIILYKNNRIIAKTVENNKMFHINNVDDVKSEWNLNETHIIIPMIDGDVINKDSDKIFTSSLTLNPMETGDQAMLNNALEHSFVIGLDKNLFEAPNYKSDLVIIQNSDLKLLSCNNDLKNPVAYALSYVDQDKSEILWQTPVQKDSNDKAVLEVRDELDYQESVHELEKKEQMNLVNINPDVGSQVSKNDEAIAHPNKDEKFINYLTAASSTETVPDLQYLDTTKTSEICRPSEKESLHSDQSRLEETVFNINENNKSKPVNLLGYLRHKTDDKEVVVSIKIKNSKNGKFDGEETYKGVSDSLPEKSLPLKKKAKMKRTVMLNNSENQRSLLKQDATAANHQGSVKSLIGIKTNQRLLTDLLKEENQSQKDSNMTLTCKGVKQRKVTKLKCDSKNSKKYTPDSVIIENMPQKEECEKIDIFGFDKNKFCSIFDLVESLRKCRMINSSIWQTLNSGLKEMDVDILKEMNAKKNRKNQPGSSDYSPQLKAFALVLYFKQPAAFNYLSELYNTGWPSLKTIKEWKRQINSQQRTTIARLETTTQHLKS